MSSIEIGNNRHGFSLIEALVAVCLISIVSGIAVISFGPAWKRHQLKMSSSDLRQRIQVTRAKALLERRTYQVIIKDNVLFRRYKAKDNWSDWEKIELSDAVSYSMKGTGNYYAKGFATPKTITLTKGQYHQKIVININGRARISEIY